MKKLIIILMICVLTIGLCACSNSAKEQQMEIRTQFIIFKYYDGGFFETSFYYMYDRDTKVVYLYTSGGSHATMCPYYIIVDDIPTLAIYGRNYFD